MKQNLRLFLFLRSCLKNRALLFLSLLFVLSSCGYRTIHPENRQTVSIPYVRGDGEGFLTTALIAELNRSGIYDYVNSGGDLELKVSIVGSTDGVVGYRYDRSEKKGKVKQNLMATENRREVAAEVALYRASQEDPVLGPVIMTASAEFDYIDVSTIKELAYVDEKDKKLKKVIDLSQGQLDSIEGAQDNAMMPLYDQLAKKIAAAIHSSYFKTLSASAD